MELSPQEALNKAAQEILDLANVTEAITQDQLQVAVWNRSFTPEQARYLATIYNATVTLAQAQLENSEKLEKLKASITRVKRRLEIIVSSSVSETDKQAKRE
jgi:hypothetical protein